MSGLILSSFFYFFMTLVFSMFLHLVRQKVFDPTRFQNVWSQEMVHYFRIWHLKWLCSTGTYKKTLCLAYKEVTKREIEKKCFYFCEYRTALNVTEKESDTVTCQVRCHCWDFCTFVSKILTTFQFTRLKITTLQFTTVQTTSVQITILQIMTLQITTLQIWKWSDAILFKSVLYFSVIHKIKYVLDMKTH